MTALDPSGPLADLALASDPMPAPVVHAAIRTIVNSVCLSVGAVRHPAVAAATRVVDALDSPGTASVLGRRRKVSVLAAPLLNGMAAHVEDFDDTHLVTVIHPGCVVVPAALAVAELTDASGIELIEAVARGVEIALRIGMTLGPGHFDRGWHLTSSTGRIGAVAAASRLLGLSHEQCVTGFALAATETAGLQEALGTMTKCFHAGKAAADGVEAALLVDAGCGPAGEPFAGPEAMAATTAPAPDLSLALDAIGERWETVDNSIKPYACGIVSHPVIDAAIAARGFVDVARVTAAVATVNPVVLDVMGVKEPATGLESKFSVYHCFAVGLALGAGGAAEFSDAAVRDPRVVALRRRLRVELDPSVRRDESHLRITADGASYSTHVEHARGSAHRQMTDEELRAKGRLLVAPVVGDRRVEGLLERAFHVADLTGMGPLVDAASPR